VSRRTLVDDILGPGGLSILFQPIFEIVDGHPTVFALEALSRGPKGTNAEQADVLFEYVRLKGKEVEVDHACVAAALRAASSVPGTPSISVNVHASTLERDERFVSYLLEACNREGIHISRMILEIVEHQQFWDRLAFFRSLARLRALGVRIALDDIGLGYSNHRMLIEVQPDFFKMDRYFVDGCTNRPHARAAIESIVLLATRMNGRVVAEGVETAADFQCVMELGIDLVQGYYLARPSLPGSFSGLTLNHPQTESRRKADAPKENPSGR
jgi:EAL domain-containing protein (putative c-di-GMP-specific phosphodiesterase class I)